MLSGAKGFMAIAKETDISQATVQHRLLDPVRCAWISRELRKSVETRLGNVIAAVYTRAVSTGDPSAAKMLLELYKQFESTPQKHLHVHTNLTGLTDEQLDKMIAQKQRQLNIIDTSITETKKDGKKG